MSKLKVSQDLIDLFHPVGEYYETSNIDFNPNTEWGGTWVEDTAGKVTVAKDNGTFKTLGDVVGSETHILTIEEMPSHKHNIKASQNDTGFGDYYLTAGKLGHYGTFDDPIFKTGGDKPHNNIQPSVVVRRWHRIA